jgi:hypothetical protein
MDVALPFVASAIENAKVLSRIMAPRICVSRPPAAQWIELMP